MIEMRSHHQDVRSSLGFIRLRPSLTQELPATRRIYVLDQVTMNHSKVRIDISY